MKRFHAGSPLKVLSILFAAACLVIVTGTFAQEEGDDDTQSQPAEVMPADTPAAGAQAPAEAKPEAAPGDQARKPLDKYKEFYAEPEGGPTHPPTKGKMVGNHWTPYDPPDPESFPAGSQVHIIVPGDTLWDLADSYLDNPWLWPQIWDLNQYILDSHWIYPGDPILMPGAPTVISQAEPAPPAPAPEPEPEPEPEDKLVQELAEQAQPPSEETAPPPQMETPPALRPIADSSDVYCSNYIDADYTPPALVIAEREEGAKTLLGPGDIVFLNQGATDGIQPGQQFSIITPGDEIWSPIDEDQYIGRNVQQVGRLQVLAVQDKSATAQIIMGCDAAQVGYGLVPFEEVPVPVGEPVPFDPFAIHLTGENDGYVVNGRDPKLSYGQGDIVNINMGTNDGVEPGRMFTIFREWAGTVEFASAETYIDGQQQRAEKLKQEAGGPTFSQSILGDLVIISARPTTATAKVLHAVREISVGDKVEMQ